MNKYYLTFEENDIPKYIQISKHIKKLIDDSKIEDGEKLMTIRTLSQMLKVNNITVVNAYKKLQSEGYAELKIGSGTYAKRKESNKPFSKVYSDFLKKNSSEKLKEFIDFTGESGGTNFLPVSTFKDIINEVLDRDGSDALVFQEQLGYSNLREEISRSFWKGEIDKENVLITSGAQQGIDVIAKALLNVNDNIIVEKPTYSGALSVFKWRRLNIFEADMLSDGIDLEQFEVILKKRRIKCFYTMSYFQNPTTSTYSLEKKIKILSLAEKYDFYVIEDDYLSELIYDNKIEYKNFKSLDFNDRVIYIKSFSKIFLPGIRMGYLISPVGQSENIQNAKINTDISTSSLMQRVLELYIRKGFWNDHINNLNNIYKERYYYMKNKLESDFQSKLFFHAPGGGLNFYVRINDEIKVNSIDIYLKGIKSNMLITPGVLFYKHQNDGSKYFRLSFSQTDKKNIDEGLKIIYNILDN